MRKFKRWLRGTFLPVWVKDGLLRENEALLDQLERQKREIRELNAYIDGLEAGMRAMRRIVIQTGVKL